MKLPRYGKFAVAALAALLGLARILYPNTLKDRVDQTSLLLLAFAATILLVPWERLTYFKAAGVELGLESPQVTAAVDAIDLNRIDNEKLRKKIEMHQSFLPRIRGARVLWIDDEQHEILGERRLLRALGITIIPAESSEKAREILQSDDDFDLLITDVQRRGSSFKETGGVRIHEGVNFVIQLRQDNNEVIRSLPVIFYTAYEWKALQQHTRPARLTRPEPAITNSVDALVTETIRQLADSRTHPIKVSPRKKPTLLRD